MGECYFMSLKNEINDIIKKIESVNVEPADVGGDEEYQICLNCLGMAADHLYGIVYYIDEHE